MAERYAISIQRTLPMEQDSVWYIPTVSYLQQLILTEIDLAPAIRRAGQQPSVEGIVRAGPMLGIPIMMGGGVK